MRVEAAARICFEVNKAYSGSEDNWDDLTMGEKEELVEAVKTAFFSNYNANIQHHKWCWIYLKKGWKWGKVKDEEKKEHPCLLPWDYLSEEDQLRDHLFVGMVELLNDKIGIEF